MLSTTAADTLITAWAFWSRGDNVFPKRPGNHWRFMRQTGYRKSVRVPWYDPDDMLLVDRALAQLKRTHSQEWGCIKAVYVERRQRSDKKLERALTVFCSLY
jgi:hypothetical protein